MTRPPRPSGNLLHLVLLLTLLGAGLAGGAPAALAGSVEGLAARLDEAVHQVDTARDGGPPLGDPGALFPETEEVTWGTEAIRVDHASLRAEWQAVPGEGEARRAALERLRHRLAAVRAELGGPGSGAGAAGRAPGGAPGTPPDGRDATAGAVPGEPPPAGWREKLTEILSRPEFKKQAARESLLARLLQWLRDKLNALLPQGTGQTAGKIVGWIVKVLAGAAILALLAVLVRAALPLFRGERRAAASPGPAAAARPETPETLLALAEARTRAGDLRGAVQASFRWVLLTLHLAGRLEYDPSLTNREHLARLKADAVGRAAFAELCGQFELVWYALRAVSREEYAAFRTRCQELARGRA